MKIIVAGSGRIGWQYLEKALKQFEPKIAGMSGLVCPCTLGIARSAYEWARDNMIPITFFPGDAEEYSWAFFAKKPEEFVVYPRGGYGLGHKRDMYERNMRMIAYGEALLAVWDGSNKKTDNGGWLIKKCTERGLRIMVYKEGREE